MSLSGSLYESGLKFCEMANKNHFLDLKEAITSLRIQNVFVFLSSPLPNTHPHSHSTSSEHLLPPRPLPLPPSIIHQPIQPFTKKSNANPGRQPLFCPNMLHFEPRLLTCFMLCTVLLPLSHSLILTSSHLPFSRHRVGFLDLRNPNHSWGGVCRMSGGAEEKPSVQVKSCTTAMRYPLLTSRVRRAGGAGHTSSNH